MKPAKYEAHNKNILKTQKRTSLMMEYEEDLITSPLEEFEDDADDATEM